MGGRKETNRAVHAGYEEFNGWEEPIRIYAVIKNAQHTTDTLLRRWRPFASLMDECVWTSDVRRNLVATYDRTYLVI